MIRRLPLVLACGLLPLVAACTGMQKPIAINPIGPSPIGVVQTSPTGFLTVYTAVKTYPVDADTWYRANSPYDVYSKDGHRVLRVANVASYRGLTPTVVTLFPTFDVTVQLKLCYHSPAPTVVTLLPGHYVVRGWADGNKLVAVPVVIKPGRCTTVNLERGHDDRFDAAPSDELVRMSDDRIVGWRADAIAAR